MLHAGAAQTYILYILQVVLAVRAASVLLLIGFARSILGVSETFALLSSCSLSLPYKEAVKLQQESRGI